jgi:integrase/recombinase XerD
MKLSEAWKEFEIDKNVQGYSPNTIKSYGLQFRLLIREIGDQDIEEVTAFHLKQYIIKQSERLKQSSLEHRIKFLRSVFRWAHEEGIIPTNPSARLKFPKQGKRVPKFLKEESLELLRIHCKTYLEGSLIEFMYSAGVRIGEVYNLNIKDFDWTSRSVIVRGKGNK